VEGEVGFHTSLDAPSQFPNYVCLRLVNRTHGLPRESENIISQQNFVVYAYMHLFPLQSGSIENNKNNV
jgi:hypothetical protein